MGFGDGMDCFNFFSPDCSVRILGQDPVVGKKVKQKIEIGGYAGDTFVLGVWGSGVEIPTGAEPKVMLKIKYGGVFPADKLSLTFGDGTYGFQFKGGVITATNDGYTAVQVQIVYSALSGVFLADDVWLVQIAP
jgi:hypothetical protein